MAVLQHTAGGETLPEPAQQHLRALPLVGAERRDVPLRGVHVVDGDEGGLAAQGEAHVLTQQLGIDLLPECLDLRPLLVGVRPRDARILMDARHAVLEAELDLCLLGRAGNRCRADRIRCAGEGNVALTGEQPRGGVEPQPARAGDEHLGPGMQIGEVLLRARGAVEGLHVRGELYQVARDETCRKPQMAQDLHQQPAGVPAGASCGAEGLLAGLHARLHADHITEVALQLLVEGDQEVHGGHGLAADPAEPVEQLWAGLADLEVGRQLLAQLVLVGEGQLLGVVLDEEVEGVDGDHLGDQVDLHGEPTGLVREHEAPDIIAEGVLLPVHEVLGRLDPERIVVDRGAHVRRGPQAHQMRAQRDRTVVQILGAMVNGNADRHGVGPG